MRMLGTSLQSLLLTTRPDISPAPYAALQNKVVCSFDFRNFIIPTELEKQNQVGVVVYAFKPNTDTEFKGNLFYIVSSRTARST